MSESLSDQPFRQPAWLVAEPYTDVDHGVVKSGKEAQVNLVERIGDDGRSCLIARKRYLPRHVTQKGQLEALGVQRASAFRHDVQYREGRQFRKTRDRRAIERMSTYGKKLLQDRWTGTEHDVMSRLWSAGVSVPYPIGFADDVFDLEYVGSWEMAAPQLSAARLSSPQLAGAFEQLLVGLRAITRGRSRPWRSLGVQPAVVGGATVVHRLPAVDRHRREPAGSRLPAPRRAERLRLVRTARIRRRCRGGVRRPAQLPLTRPPPAMSQPTVYGGFAHRYGGISACDEPTDRIRRFRSSREVLGLSAGDDSGDRAAIGHGEQLGVRGPGRWQRGRSGRRSRRRGARSVGRWDRAPRSGRR